MIPEEVFEFDLFGSIGKEQFRIRQGWSEYMFRRNVHENKIVFQKLVEETGYDKRLKTLNQKQVQIICEHCGYPKHDNKKK